MAYPQVVKIYAASQEPSYENPWQANSLENGSGSGVVIGSGEILTGAHVVANSTFIQVRKIENPDKVVATVKEVCHDCDLAVLRVDKSFTDGIKPVQIGELPNLQDKVSVIGFPIGGDEISITEGVVSRVEVQQYSHSQRYLIAATVDAAINNGNSGGPVFKGDKVVGIAFQAMEDAQNIGEIVPASLILHFLKGIEQKKPSVIPGDGIMWMNLENAFFRKHLGMTQKQRGVLVVDMDFGSTGWGAIKKGDVLMSIDGNKIANNGTILYRNRFRTGFESVFCDHYVGESIEIEFLRGTILHKTTITLGEQTNLVPRSTYDTMPTYFIFGGLVFQPLTRNYLETWSSWPENAPNAFITAYYQGTITEQQKEHVVLSKVLAHEINVGYEKCYEELVTEVNGVIPRDIHHFIDLVNASQKAIEITTCEHSVIMLDVEQCKNKQSEILKRYRIDADRSKNLVGGI